jgi:hypothetical protein
MPEYEFNELQYSNDREGPWRLYIYEPDGYHSGGQWFRRPPLKYPDEEITAREAMHRALQAEVQQKEVRICDGGDMLIYHWKDGKILYPAQEAMRTFWNEIVGGK